MSLLCCNCHVLLILRHIFPIFISLKLEYIYNWWHLTMTFVSILNFLVLHKIIMHLTINPVCMSECSVVSDSLWPHGLQPVRLLCAWVFLGKNTGVDCYSLLQGVFPVWGLNPHLLSLLHWQADSSPLSHRESP